MKLIAESGQYAQLGFFVSKLKLSEVLKDVDTTFDEISSEYIVVFGEWNNTTRLASSQCDEASWILMHQVK